MSNAKKRFAGSESPKKELSRKERDDLIIAHLPFIKGVCFRTVSKIQGLRAEEFLGVAVIGFIDALSKYDESRDNKFKTYAEYRVRGAIIDEMRANDEVSRHTRDMKKKVDAAKAVAEAKSGCNYSSADAAEQMGVSIETFFSMERKSAKERMVSMFTSADAQGGRQGGRTVSLDVSLSNFDSSQGEGLGSNGEDQLLLGDIRRAVDHSLGSLDATELLVISMHHFEELRLVDIGELLNYSESRVGHIHSRAMSKIERAFRAEYKAEDDARELKQRCA